MWRRGRTEVMAPADGIISRRMARVGGYAAGAAEPMFRIVANGEVELDAEVIEDALAERQGRPEGARRGRRRRRRRRQRAAGLAGGRQGDPPRPRAHLPRRQSGPAGRRLCPRHGSRRRTAAASPCPRPPSSTARGPPRCRWCATHRVEKRRSRSGSPPARWSRCDEGLQRGRSRRHALRHLPARRRCRAAVVPDKAKISEAQRCTGTSRPGRSASRCRRSCCSWC